MGERRKVEDGGTYALLGHLAKASKAQWPISSHNPKALGQAADHDQQWHRAPIAFARLDGASASTPHAGAAGLL
jgi:hypothetical protein